MSGEVPPGILSYGSNCSPTLVTVTPQDKETPSILPYKTHGSIRRYSAPSPKKMLFTQLLAIHNSLLEENHKIFFVLCKIENEGYQYNWEQQLKTENTS